MHILLFILVSLLLYVAADWLLKTLERRRGVPFDNRALVFFAILLGLALITFSGLRYFLTAPPAGPTAPSPRIESPR